MTVKDIINIAREDQLIEIASPRKYYYGLVKDVPFELYNYIVGYIASGASDTDGTNNTLLLDAIGG